MNIKEIAQLAGVSTATVSRVLNESGYVKETTRQRILRVISETKYVPNALARSLITQQRRSIGVIVPDISNEFFAEVFRGISDAAENRQYTILIFNSDENAQREWDALRAVQGEQLVGLLIAPVSCDDPKTASLLTNLETSGIPVVLVDRTLKDVSFDAVVVDNFQGAYDGVSALIEAGHHRIASIIGPVDSLPGVGRRDGYRQALADHGIAWRPDYELSGDFHRRCAYEQTKALLSLPMPPTAIFTSNNLTSLGCLKYLTEHRMIPGKDIGVLGFDGIMALNDIAFPFSAVERDAAEQGRQAMNRLLERINHPMCPTSVSISSIPHYVVLRGSERIQ